MGAGVVLAEPDAELVELESDLAELGLVVSAVVRTSIHLHLGLVRGYIKLAVEGLADDIRARSADVGLGQRYVLSRTFAAGALEELEAIRDRSVYNRDVLALATGVASVAV